MDEKLIKSFDRLEKIRIRLIKNLEHYSEEQLNYRPYNLKVLKNQWSLIQIVFHLVIWENVSIKYMQHKLIFPDTLETPGFSTFFKISLLKIGLLLRVKYSTPKFLVIPPVHPKFHDVCSTWEQSRAMLKRLIEKTPDDILKKGIFQYPPASILNMQQTLEFMQAHLKHQIRQIKARRKKLQKL